VLKSIVLIGIMLMFPLLGYTQVVPPPVPPPPPPGLPIDGFVKILFLVGIVYGSKKIIKE